jgi:hypothetical protein
MKQHQVAGTVVTHLAELLLINAVLQIKHTVFGASLDLEKGSVVVQYTEEDTQRRRVHSRTRLGRTVEIQV